MSKPVNSSTRPSEPGSTGALATWARWVAYHSWRVLGGSFLAIVIFVAIAIAVAGEFSDAFTIPGVESQRAFDLLKERFPQQSGDSATIVFQTEGDALITDAEPKARIDALLAEIAALPRVVGVTSPLDATYQIS